MITTAPNAIATATQSTATSAAAASANTPSSNGARSRSGSRREDLGAANTPQSTIANAGAAIPRTTDAKTPPTLAPQNAKAAIATSSSPNLTARLVSFAADMPPMIANRYGGLLAGDA